MKFQGESSRACQKNQDPFQKFKPRGASSIFCVFLSILDPKFAHLIIASTVLIFAILLLKGYKNTKLNHNVSKFFVYTFIIGCFLGCLGGAASAPMISVVPGVGVEIIVLAFPLHFSQGTGPKISTLGNSIEMSFTLTAVGIPERFALEVNNGPVSYTHLRAHET